MTTLDHAHAAMQADPENNAARLRFFETLCAGELFLLLQAEPIGDAITPMEFPLEDHRCVLVFDRAERLTDFTEKASAYVAMPGRQIIAMLAGQGLGLGVNLSVAPSSILIPPHAIDWLVELLQGDVTVATARPDSVAAPLPMTAQVMDGLGARIASAAGSVTAAFLVAVRYDNTPTRNLLALFGVPEVAQSGLRSLIAETLAFNAEEDIRLSVGFFDAENPLYSGFAEVGLRLDMPLPPVLPEKNAPTPPGMDPEKPPIL